MARKKEEKNIVKEINVNEEESAEVVDVVTKEETNEETKEENTSAEIKNNDVETSDAADVSEKKPKRKYTKRDTKTTESKTAEKASSKKSKKDAKPVESVQELYIEFGDSKIFTEELINRIKEAYKSEGHRISSIKTLQVYMNVDERKAYYVINGKAEGKFVNF